MIDAATAKAEDPKDVTVDKVMEEWKCVKMRSFTKEQTEHFLRFRLAMTPQVAQCFRTMMFHSVCGRVRVNSLDYKVVSTLDPRAMWIKVAILVRHYMSTLTDKFHVAPGASFSSADFMGRPSSCNCPKLKPSYIQEMSC